jgi:hypothetical protein
MSPDTDKIKAICEWPIPSTTAEVQRFLGLASYYRRYIRNFAGIAHPLHQLSNKGTTFQWTETHQMSFTTLKNSLTSHPVLICPDFSLPFTLYTDASDTGLGAILHQEDKVVAYENRSLKPAEKNYSTIEKGCLALLYGIKYFKHYLLGHPFTVYTDHNPLQWLSAQKMEGKLSRWALQLQEFDFKILYRKGSQNINADALSRKPCKIAATEIQCGPSDDDLRRAQVNDPMILKIIKYLKMSKRNPRLQNQMWKQPQMKRWHQLLPKLVLRNGILYRHMTQPVSRQEFLILIAPSSLKKDYLQQFHDAPLAGHQGYTKTLDLRRKNVLLDWNGYRHSKVL